MPSEMALTLSVKCVSLNKSTSYLSEKKEMSLDVAKCPSRMGGKGKITLRTTELNPAT